MSPVPFAWSCPVWLQRLGSVPLPETVGNQVFYFKERKARTNHHHPPLTGSGIYPMFGIYVGFPSKGSTASLCHWGPHKTVPGPQVEYIFGEWPLLMRETDFPNLPRSTWTAQWSCG